MGGGLTAKKSDIIIYSVAVITHETCHALSIETVEAAGRRNKIGRKMDAYPCATNDARDSPILFG